MTNTIKVGVDSEEINSSGAPSPIQSRIPSKLQPTTSIPSIQSSTSATNSQSPTTSPASASYTRRQPFSAVLQTNEFNAASSTDDSTSGPTTTSQAVLLGIQTLERQQAELERKRQMQRIERPRENPFDPVDVYSNRPQDHAHPHTGVPTTVHLNGDADDELTMVSDLKGVGVQPAPTQKKHNRMNSIGKLLKTPLKPIRRTLSDRFNIDPNTPTGSISEQRMKPIIFGFLHKLGRNNKWQKRWFESDGTCLQYFKSKEKEKCLATLDLLRVGTILMDVSDGSGCTFTIEVAGRQYYLCADTKERAMDWVITLNRVKEARNEIGGLKLIDPDFVHDQYVTLNKKRSGSDSDEENVAPRVVMNTSRPRTKGLGKDDFSDMEKSIEDDCNVDGALVLSTTYSPSAASGSLGSTSPRHTFHHPQINLLPPHMQNQVAVRWTKQRSAVQNWARRLSRWAKRTTMVRCVIKDDVVHLNSNLRQQQQHESDASSDKEDEEPFIDLDIARYSNCPESYVEGHVTNSVSYGDEASNQKSNFDFVDHSGKNTIQHSSSWKVQKNEGASGGSVQSSPGRISPAVVNDDGTFA